MSPTFFTTTDGDVILRAGPGPDSKHDFRVQNFILSLAPPVSRDTIAFPQPPEQIPDEHQLPVVDVLDPPGVLDTILQFIYPGVEFPKITELSRLGALLATADKYNIASIYLALRGVLKVLLPRDPFVAYLVASRFGFLEEAREAAKVSNTNSFINHTPGEDLRYISSTDLFRFAQFVQQREHSGRRRIQNALGPYPLDEGFVQCGHGDKAKGFYFRLEKAVEEVFIEDPRVGSKDLFALLDQVPDPLLAAGRPRGRETGIMRVTTRMRSNVRSNR